MTPEIINGNIFTDTRGSLSYNNSFDVSAIKRIYIIENANIEVIRGWKGHLIEKRWFSAIEGTFKIDLIKINSEGSLSAECKQLSFTLEAQQLNVLYVPAGYASSIQAKKNGSKLLAMSDHFLNEVQDEVRFDL